MKLKDFVPANIIRRSETKTKDAIFKLKGRPLKVEFYLEYDRKISRRVNETKIPYLFK